MHSRIRSFCFYIPLIGLNATHVFATHCLDRWENLKAMKVQRNEKKLFVEVKHIILCLYNGSHRHQFAIVYAWMPYTCKFTSLEDLWLTVNAISAWRGVRDDICHLHEQIQSKQVFCFQSLLYFQRISLFRLFRSHVWKTYLTFTYFFRNHSVSPT